MNCFFLSFLAVCADGQVRLANGRNGTQGRVEICFLGIWGTICDDFWDENEASVVCRQLGLQTTGQYM